MGLFLQHMMSKSKQDNSKIDSFKCLICSQMFPTRMKAVEHILTGHELKIDQGDSISKYFELNL